MFLVLYRATKFALQNFSRNLWLSIVTIFILTLTLFTISLVAGINLMAQQTINAIEEKVDMDIFFVPKTEEANILSAQKFLSNLPEVQEVKYISQDMALEQFKATHASDMDIQSSLEELDENPLPASLIIKAKNLDNYSGIISKFEASEFNTYTQSKDYSDNQEVINRIQIIINRVYEVGLVLSLIFVLISIIVVFNTVRLTIYSHREELGIMKLVGATNAFIRAPFLIEGLLYALVSSFLTLVIIYPLMLVASPYVDNFFMGYDFSLMTFAYQHWWQIFALQFLISLVLSVSSTSLAVSRHLKV